MRRGSTFLDARGWKRGWHGLAPMVTTKLFSSARNGGMSQSATARGHLGDGHADAVLEALAQKEVAVWSRLLGGETIVARDVWPCP
jgi:hypothetical protein